MWTRVTIVVAAVALLAPAPGRAYPWPLAPFDRPHPIRGGFDDPRLHIDFAGVESLTSFHFGVDIAAADGTPVYAVAPGRVSVHPGNVVLECRGGRVFGYWHVASLVATGEHVRLHQILGYVTGGWEHLHFAESRGAGYLDPLRPGGLTPFRDRTRPTVAWIRLVDPRGRPVPAGAAVRTDGVVAEVFDTPPLRPPPPWQLARLAPAAIRWRLVRDGRPWARWRVVVDFARAGALPQSLFDWVYARGTTQNKPGRPGRYVYWIAHALAARRLPPGRYEVEVRASDTRGNVGTGSLRFRVGAAVSGGRA